MNRERNRMCAAVQSPAWDFLHHGPAVTTAAPDRNIAAVVPAGIRPAVKLWSAPEKKTNSAPSVDKVEIGNHYIIILW